MVIVRCGMAGYGYGMAGYGYRKVWSSVWYGMCGAVMRMIWQGFGIVWYVVRYCFGMWYGIF